MKYPRVPVLGSFLLRRGRVCLSGGLVTAGFVLWIWASEPLSDLGFLLFIGWLGLVSSRGQN